MFVQNFSLIGPTVRELCAKHYRILFFRCNYQVGCITLIQCISKTRESIVLKFHRHACWHVLRQYAKFRGDSRISFEIKYTFAIFVVVSLLFFRRLLRHVEFTNVDLIRYT